MILLFFYIHLSAVLCQPYYSNYWAVKIDGGIEKAKDLATQHGFEFIYEIIPGYYSFKHRSIRKRSVKSSQHHHSKLLNDAEVLWAEQQVIKKRVKRDSNQNAFNDPLWPQMWYLARSNGYDMRVVDVYRKHNITGRGVRVSILDDGLEKDHPDIIQNYDPGSSYDVNDDDDDPQPSYLAGDTNRHGTRCAGEVAAAANNGICGVGVAYNAAIGGVRMLDGPVSDSVESKSLGLNPQHIHIYSVSWGPEDNGKTVDGPGRLAKQTIFDGIYKGRNKLGNIFVWASGNGGLKGDSCACDGYTNLIYTLSVSSASENGRVPWYSEPCSSTLATTYSSGSSGEKRIVTTDLRKRCTSDHTGTSASAPLAAGICALVLEANPQLTWRDMQYIVFLTAREANLVASDWVVNGVGKKVSHHFGYGLMDATAMVEAALDWSPIPDHHRCATEPVQSEIVMANFGESSSIIATDGCNETSDYVRYLEHVECIVTVTNNNRRGELELFLTSPMGTKSQLLIRRAEDFSFDGFYKWAFMTTHCWGENPAGEWTLEAKTHRTAATLTQWSLAFYGVDTMPTVYSKYLTTTPKHQSTASQPTSFSRHNITLSSLQPQSSDGKATKKFTCAGLYRTKNNACVRECPSGYYASIEDMTCKQCRKGCAYCLNDRDCIGDRSSNKSTIIAVAIVGCVIAISVALLLYKYLKKSSSSAELWNTSNNKLLYKSTFHSSSMSKEEYILPVDAIKEPLLPTEDSPSSDDEGSKSNIFP